MKITLDYVKKYLTQKSTLEQKLRFIIHEYANHDETLPFTRGPMLRSDWTIDSWDFDESNEEFIEVFIQFKYSPRTDLTLKIPFKYLQGYNYVDDLIKAKELRRLEQEEIELAKEDRRKLYLQLKEEFENS